MSPRNFIGPLLFRDPRSLVPVKRLKKQLKSFFYLEKSHGLTRYESLFALNGCFEVYLMKRSGITRDICRAKGLNEVIT